ncbi:MAG TPA: hypothetical protein PLE45_03265 [Spirochaetota bacterium]|nr:hypothetical protein [Spirochaetota bacterium]HOL56216.1 hypothetical protein [Spirochaetota bacterium]HPP03833.1 hypothetical protein [Spirochaetota bacterium]
MKKIYLIFITILTLSCYSPDPLFHIRRLARSEDLTKKEEASLLYRQAIDTLVNAYSSLGGLNKDVGRRLMMSGEYLSAIKHFEIARDIRNNDSTIYYWLAVCYVNLYKIEKDPKYFELIEKNYEISLNLTPENKEVLYAYAQFLVYGKEDYFKAIEILKKLVVLLKNNSMPDAYFLLGRAYYMVEDYENALKIYETLKTFEKVLTKEQKEKLDEFIITVRGVIKNE